MLEHAGPIFDSIIAVLDAHSGAITALATLFVAAFTLTLWRATKKTAVLTQQIVELGEQQFSLEAIQSDILERQKEIARLQYFAEHRPRLVVKDVYFSSADDFKEVTAEIVNAGQSLAMISGGFVGLDFISDPRQFKDAKDRTLGPLKASGLRAGQFRPFGFRLSESVQRKLRYLITPSVYDPQTGVNVHEDPGAKPIGPFYFFGAIFYTDERGEETGSTYLSVFRRQWNPGKGFERTGNPDHEYSD